MRGFLISIGLGVLIFDAFLFVNPDKGTNYNFLFNLAYGLIYLVGAIVAFTKSKKFIYAINMKRAMTFYSFGMFAYAVGLFVWTYYNLVLHIEIPYPSLADIAFLLFYPGMILGTFFLLKSYGGKITGRLIIESVSILVILFTILYLFLNQTSLGPNVDFWAKLLNVLYPLGDSFIVALGVTLLRAEKVAGEHPNILFFVFGFTIAATADTIFSFRSANSLYWNGDVSDLLFAISGFLIAWGILNVKIPSLTDHSLS